MKKQREYKYVGVLAEICSDFVAEKHALGFDYDRIARRLSEFSRFSLDFEFEPNTLPESLVKAWIAYNPLSKDRTIESKYTLIRRLAEYMIRHGMSAFMASSVDIKKINYSYKPYVFTHEEIDLFFKAADEMKLSPYSNSPRQHLVMPVIFKVLYCCGLRVSEALSLLGSDVDLEKGILLIRQSKGNKSRYVPISSELTNILKKYDFIRIKQKENDWFFPNHEGNNYSLSHIYSVFRQILSKCGISHGGRNVGPRLHDFRHTFAVHCLQKWIKDGNDLTSALPYLSTYLGHETMRYTEPYLRMTAEVYPEVVKTLQDRYGYIIPKIDDLDYENN